MTIVLKSIADCTPAWLTDVLYRQQLLTQGEVTEITIDRTLHMASLNHILAIRYSPDAATTAPQTLFLKLTRPDRLPLNDSEVVYYRHLGASLTPHCYDAQFDSQDGAYHVLLEDVSRTHTAPHFPLPPTQRHAKLMVECLARLHAAWWENPHLAEVATIPTPEVIHHYINHCQGGLDRLMNFMGDRLPSARRDLLALVFDRHRHQMIQRAGKHQHLTLIHGDSHGANFLLPLNEADERVYLIDRQPFDWSLTSWLGVSDLAYMMIHWWFPEHRRALERPLLEHYWQTLQRLGVQNYSWDQLWEDYRLCAIQSLYVAVEWGRDDPIQDMAFIWYPQLQHTFIALDDLNCHELLT